MNILSVARSLNNYVVKVVVTADAVEGVLTSFDNGKIQLEGENFDLSESCIENASSADISVASTFFPSPFSTFPDSEE